MPVVLVDGLAGTQDVYAGGNRTDAPATLSSCPPQYGLDKRQRSILESSSSGPLYY